MAIAFGTDLAALLAGDFGVDVVHGATTTRGILTRAGDFLRAPGGMAVQAQSDQVLIRDGTLPDLAVDDELTIGGIAYRVHEVGELDDGAGRTILIAEEP